MEKVITTRRIGSLTVMAIFSPTNGVTNPRIIRPVVIPSQIENGAACRTSFMNVTTHPPKATSIPTYPRRKIEQIQLTAQQAS
jgi:nitrous oxide reductase accessory protein NosL